MYGFTGQAECEILQSPSKRIMHVINGLGLAGAERLLVKVLEASRGPWEHIVVSLLDEWTPLTSRLVQLGIPVHVIGLKRSIPNPVRALSAIGLARRLRPHLIEGWMYYSNLLANVAAAALPERVPVFWNIDSSLYDIGEERLRTAASIRLSVPFSRRPDAIIYRSRIGAWQHGRFGFHSRRQVIIPNGFNCQVFYPDENTRREVRRELGVTDDQVLVGLVARFHPMKDHPTFFKAAATVVQAYPNVRFALLGADKANEEIGLQKLVADHGLQSYVLLLPERNDMERLTNALDISCSSSCRGEAFSSAIGEAMACAVPCLVTHVGDNAYLVSDTGVAVPPRNSQAFAEGLMRLIKAGEGGRRRLGNAARRRIKEHFTMPRIARAYDNLYQEHLAPSKAPIVSCDCPVKRHNPMSAAISELESPENFATAADNLHRD